MEYDEAYRIVVQAGKEGQKVLLDALMNEMKLDDSEEALKKHGYVPED